MALNNDTIKIIKYLHANCVRNYATSKAIHDNFINLNHSNFWRIAHNSALDIAVIEWCKLFGAYKESTHFTNSKERGIQNLEKQILSVCKTTKADYDLLHTSLLKYRDKSVAHIDKNNWQVNVPYLSKAVEHTYISFDIFAANVDIKGCDIRQEFTKQYGETMTAIETFVNYGL